MRVPAGRVLSGPRTRDDGAGSRNRRRGADESRCRVAEAVRGSRLRDPRDVRAALRLAFAPRSRQCVPTGTWMRSHIRDLDTRGLAKTVQADIRQARSPPSARKSVAVAGTRPSGLRSVCQEDRLRPPSATRTFDFSPMLDNLTTRVPAGLRLEPTIFSCDRLTGVATTAGLPRMATTVIA